MAITDAYWEYPNAGWWHLKEKIAKKMSDAQLEYSRKDSFQAATIGVPENYGKYMDENSVYIQEIKKREKVAIR